MSKTSKTKVRRGGFWCGPSFRLAGAACWLCPHVASALCAQRGPRGRGWELRVSPLLTGTPVLLDRGPTLMTSLNLLTS